MGNYVLVTKDVYTAEDFKGSVQEKVTGAVKEFQRVVEVGPTARNVNVGELVSIDPKRYAVTKYREGDIKGNIEGMQKIVSYNIPEITLNHQKYMLISDQDITFVIEDFDEEQSKSNLILPRTEIIQP